MTSMEPLEPSEAFARLGHLKLGETDLDGVLNQVADLAKRSLPGAEEVSVTLVRGKDAHTAAFTGDLAMTLDEWQYERGYGPCLDAAESGESFSLTDMVTETRWPGFAGQAVQAGCLSSLSIALPVQDRVTGGLNIYAGKPRAFDDDAISVAHTFAGYAAVALANAHLYDSTATLAHHMQAAMDNRAVIEQAKGILMGERRISSDEAFLILRKYSQDSNRKLRDVAATLVARAPRRPEKE
jgi:GAF domain-containing protein